MKITALAPTEPAKVNEADTIVNFVMCRLGRPSTLYKVVALRLLLNCWRVNVWCRRPSDNSYLENLSITDSFFVATEGGAIVVYDKKRNGERDIIEITRRY